jgi:hypothetical protein
MRRTLTLLVGVAAMATLAAGGAAAQANATATPAPTPTGGDLVADNVTVGPVVSVDEARYDGETLTLHLRAETVSPVTVSQSIQDPGEGAARFRIKQRTLSSGETTIVIDAPRVTVVTPGCVQRQSCVLIVAKSDGSLSGSATLSDVALAGLSSALVTAVGTWRFARKRLFGDEPVSERIL